MIRRILAATDFSDCARVGTDQTAAIASAQGSSVHLLHCLHIPPQNSPYRPSSSTLGAEIGVVAGEKLQDLADSMRASGIEVTTSIREAKAAEGISAEAADVGADLIVLGNHGMGVIEQLILGSTAQRTITQAECPVLVVPAVESDTPGRTGKILLPTDFSEESMRSAEEAIALVGSAGDGVLVLAHVADLPLEFGAYGETIAAGRYIEEALVASREGLGAWAETLREKGWSVRTEVATGIAAVEIERIAEENDIDLIAMGTHGHTGLKKMLLGSTARQVLQHTKRPVLTVRH